MKSSSPTPAPPPPPPTPPLSCYGVEKKEHSENKDFVTCRFFFYHGALSLQVIHTGRNKTLSDSVIFMAFFYPQLLQGQKDGKCFEKFQEGELTFPPTYKYNPGTDQWDTER